jgi:hypothetical protein
VHHVGIMFAREDVARTTHIGGQLIDFVDAGQDRLDGLDVPQVAENELVGRSRAEFRPFQVGAPYPTSFGSQSLYEMAADEATRACNQDSLHVCIS